MPIPFSTLGAIVFLAKATVILLAALGITRLMQRSSAGARHLVWLVALGALLLVPALQAWSPLRLAILPAAPSSKLAPQNVIVSDAKAPVAGITGAFAPSNGVEGAARSSVGSALPTSTDASSPARPTTFDLPSWPVLLAALWALVALGILASLAWAGLAVRRIVRRAWPLETPAWRNPLFEIADRLGLDEAPRLLCSDDVKMPFACGVLAPTIVLPAECERWTLERRRAVLLHELAHVRRHDLLGHTIGRLACAAYWFHPLVWTAARALRSESERACDDLALACGTDAPDYAEHLLDIVTSVRGDTTPLVALAMARRKEFEGRMLAILDPELRRAAPSRRQSLGMIGTLALLAITVGAAAPVPRAQQAQAEARHAAADARADARIDRDSRELGPMPTITDSATRASMRMETRELTKEERTAAREVARDLAHDTEVPVEIGKAAGSASGAAIGAAAGAAAGATANAVVRKTVPAVLGALAEGFTTIDLRQAKTPDERATLLAKVLRTDTSATLRRVAAWGLAEYANEPVAVEALSNALLHDASASVREMAAWALADGDEGRPAAVSALATALRSDASGDVRTTAAWALGNVGDRSAAALDALTSALSSSDRKLRVRALWAIGNISPKQAPKPVLAMLKDSEPKVRELAAWALYQIEDPEAVPALRAAAESEQNKEVQIAEIRALATLGEQSVDALKGLLESPDPRVKSMAVHALAGGSAAGPWPMPWPEPRPFP
jgi:beta-lactamase regulating signal transducer with metallopeptidase domain/HEAT repeat protein